VLGFEPITYGSEASLLPTTPQCPIIIIFALAHAPKWFDHNDRKIISDTRTARCDFSVISVYCPMLATESGFPARFPMCPTCYSGVYTDSLRCLPIRFCPLAIHRGPHRGKPLPVCCTCMRHGGHKAFEIIDKSRPTPLELLRNTRTRYEKPRWQTVENDWINITRPIVA